MRELAPAKINLCLYVGPLRPDGYHELVSVMHDLRRNALWKPVFDFLQKRGEKALANRGLEAHLPVELSHGTGEMDPTLLQGYKWSTGHKLGTWMRESMQKGAQAVVGQRCPRLATADLVGGVTAYDAVAPGGRGTETVWPTPIATTCST